MRARLLRVSLFASSVLCCATAASFGATVTETFEGGTNAAGWSYGFDSPDNTGGNPGWWLHAVGLDTFAPSLSTNPSIPSAFTGNLRAKGVTSMAMDARIDHTDFNIGGDAFSMTLLLRKTNGTPDDVSDDDYAWFAGEQVPVVGSGWQHYDFPVPAAQTTLPAGWKGGSPDDPESFRPGVTWNDIVTSADIVEFDYLKPGFFAIFQQWDTGADNISVTSVPEPGCVAVVLMIAAGLATRRRRA
jgi:hypothetical protein